MGKEEIRGGRGGEGAESHGGKEKNKFQASTVLP